LKEITRHFDETVLITNNKTLLGEDEQFLIENKIRLMLVTNEGFDFGMWYKAFNDITTQGYDRIGLINDSCILFKNLDEVFDIINKSDWDYCGILDTVQISYHLQSYFIIINKHAIKYVDAYFKKNGIIKNFDETIQKYEVGISKYILDQNLKTGSVFSYKINFTNRNPSYFSIEELLSLGFPIIKKKIIFGDYRKKDYLYLKYHRFNFNPKHYINIIRRNNHNLILDFDSLNVDYKYLKTKFRLLILNIYYFFHKNYNKFRKVI
jgi:hypothetical protein